MWFRFGCRLEQPSPTVPFYATLLARNLGIDCHLRNGFNLIPVLLVEQGTAQLSYLRIIANMLPSGLHAYEAHYRNASA